MTGQSLSSHLPRTAGRTWLTPAVCLVAAGWGSNQFSPLIVLYQDQIDPSPAVLQGLYGLYALGLLPALLIGGRLSDRYGRRRTMLPALLLALVATSVLAFADGRTAWLFTGRLLTGVYCGLVLSAGVAWLKERSTLDDDSRSSMRATLAITFGFAAGPLIAGMLAQFAPRPQITAYMPHLAMTVVALTATARGQRDLPARTQPEDVRKQSSRFPVRAFVYFFGPYAPWVFASAAVFLAYLTPLAASDLDSYTLVFSAACGTLGAAAGIAVQPLTKVLHRLGETQLVVGSMTIVILGLLVGAWAVAAGSAVLVLVDAAVLGGGYGVCQYCGILEAQQAATPSTLGKVISAYQVLSYTGFALPYLMVLAGERFGLEPATLLLLVACLALVCAVASGVGQRHAHALGTSS